MPLPGNLSVRTVMGTYVDLTGAPVVGSVTFTMDYVLTDVGAAVVIIPKVIRGVLDEDGFFSVSLPVSDDPDVSPNGFSYKVTEQFDGLKGRTFYMEVPTGATPIDISSVASNQTPAPLPNPIYALAADLISEQSARLAADADTVRLTGAQTITGSKTFDANVTLATDRRIISFASAVDALLFTASNNGDTVDRFQLRSGGDMHWGPGGGAALDVKLYRDSGALASNSLLRVHRATATDPAHSARVTADANARWYTRADGMMLWGPGGATQDTNLYRSAADTLSTDDAFTIGGAGTFSNGFTVSGSSGTSSAAAASTTAWRARVTGDAVDRWAVTGDGTVSWGDGTNSRDTTLSRLSANILAANSALRSVRLNATDAAFSGFVSGDSVSRFVTQADGKLLWSAGSGSADVSLYRAAADILATDDTIRIIRTVDADDAISIRQTGDTASRYLVEADGATYWGPGGSTAVDVKLYRGGVDLLKTDDNFDALNFPSGAASSWSPTWTTSTGANTPTFGNAQIDCTYIKFGRLVHAWFEVIFGSTTNFNGGTTSDNWRFSLPVTGAATTTCIGFLELNSATNARVVARARMTTTSVFEIETSSGRPDAVAVTNNGLVDAVSPWTWASGNAIRGHLAYMAAA